MIFLLQITIKEEVNCNANDSIRIGVNQKLILARYNTFFVDRAMVLPIIQLNSLDVFQFD